MTIIPSSYQAKINDDNSLLNYEHENILKIFEALPQGSHVSISELYNKLKKQGKVNITTVYHTIKTMIKVGVLRELKMDTDQRYYAINASFPQEHYIVCVQCNRLIKFEDSSIIKHSIQQVEKNDWHILDYQLTIYGICAEGNEISCLSINWSLD